MNDDDMFSISKEQLLCVMAWALLCLCLIAFVSVPTLVWVPIVCIGTWVAGNIGRVWSRRRLVKKRIGVAGRTVNGDLSPMSDDREHQ